MLGGKSLEKLQLAYRKTFKSNEYAKQVLADLRLQCYATRSIIDAPDVTALEAARREGMRQVFMRIMNMLEYDYNDYYEFDPEDYLDD